MDFNSLTQGQPYEESPAFFDNQGQAPRFSEFDMADDFKEYQVTMVADLPKQSERKTIRTKSVKEVASEINYKKITSKIQDYDIKKGGIFSKDIVTFQIVSDEPGKLFKMRSYRTDEDFYELRRLMVIALPYVMVPPLPAKNLNSQDRKIPKRQRLYQRFLNSIHRSEVLKSVQIFVDFIKLPDRLDCQNAMKRAEKVKVFNVVSDNGFMDVRNVH